MGVRISDKSNVCLYCSTEGVAFGPIFPDADEAQRFLDWIKITDGRDPREIPGGTLIRWYADWNGEPARDPDKSDISIYGAGSS